MCGDAAAGLRRRGYGEFTTNVISNKRRRGPKDAVEDQRAPPNAGVVEDKRAPLTAGVVEDQMGAAECAKGAPP